MRQIAFDGAFSRFGKACALTVLVTIGILVVRGLRDIDSARRITARGLIATGAIAALGLSFIAATPGDSTAAPNPRDQLAASSCTQRPSTPPPPQLNGKHPDRVFYKPGQAPPRRDLLHVMGDGFVIVEYRSDISSAEQDALATWAKDSPLGVIAAPGAATMTTPLRATTRVRTLTCPSIDLDGLSGFRDLWFQELRRSNVVR